MVIVLILCIIICIAVIWLTVVTTNKAYAYKHSVDPVDSHSPIDTSGEQEFKN